MSDAPRTGTSIGARVGDRLRKAVLFEPGEIRPLLISSVYFFCILAAYYIVRPIREEMGVKVGRDGLQTLFTVVFFVMVAAVPLFGWVATRFKRGAVVPVVYCFFIANLIVFWAAFTADIGSTWLAGAFFVWVSVFNLFVISLFWSLMSDLWSSDQAKRLYGAIAAGGTAGAFFGPLLTKMLVKPLGATNLLLVSVALLCLSLGCVAALRRMKQQGDKAGDTGPPKLADIVAGATNVWRSPYLFQIALVILLANLISTYFYFEQNRIVGATIADQDARVELFATIDLSVSVLTILAQLFLTGSLMNRLGIGLTAAALPLSVIVGLVAIAISPSLWVIVTVVVIERAVAFAFANPAFKVLYTVVDPDDKYKAQNFIDTVVYRGGDAASGWLFNDFAKKAALSMPVVALMTLPLAVWWLWLALNLGRRQTELAKSQAASKAASSLISVVR
jgi:ATP:ADP antiporter, AAA family